MSDTRKDLKEQYRHREVIGCIYATRNKTTGQMLLAQAANMVGARNRFEFSQSTKACPDLRLQAAWKEYGAEAFEFVVLEEVKKSDTQSDAEFIEDLKALLELWAEKTPQDSLY